MKCADEGLWRTYFDNEIGVETRNRLTEHLADCSRCRSTLETIAESSDAVAAILNNLESRSVSSNEKLSQAYEDLSSNRLIQHRSFPLMFDRRLWTGLALVCLLTVLLAFPSGRSWAQHILEMLRVNKVAVVPVEMPDIEAEARPGKLAAQFLSDNVVITLKPGEPLQAANVADASTAAGFAVRTVGNSQPVRITVSSPFAFHMTLNQERLEALLQAAGRTDILIPAGSDGSTVAAYVPKSVAIAYDGVDLMQVPTPTVSVSKSLDMSAIAEAGLQVAGLSASEAHAFCSSVDWSSTLVIPIPRADSAYRSVNVDGVSGTLIEVQGTKHDPNAAGLVWVRNGMLYALHANTADVVLQAAASLN